MEAYAGTMYDAVLLYALAVNETLESGKSIRNGLEVSKRTYNRVYEGMVYCFSLEGGWGEVCVWWGGGVGTGIPHKSDKTDLVSLVVLFI